MVHFFPSASITWFRFRGSTANSRPLSQVTIPAPQITLQITSTTLYFRVAKTRIDCAFWNFLSKEEEASKNNFSSSTTALFQKNNNTQKTTVVSFLISDCLLKSKKSRSFSDSFIRLICRRVGAVRLFVNERLA